MLLWTKVPSDNCLLCNCLLEQSSFGQLLQHHRKLFDPRTNYQGSDVHHGVSSNTELEFFKWKSLVPVNIVSTHPLLYLQHLCKITWLYRSIHYRGLYGSLLDNKGLNGTIQNYTELYSIKQNNSGLQYTFLQDFIYNKHEITWLWGDRDRDLRVSMML